MLAFPEIEVSGVRRSWEMDRSRLARSCSFFARTAAASFSSRFFWFSRARAHSPRTESRMLVSKESRGLSAAAIPMTPYTRSPVRMDR